ncbi:MAG: XdhC family protein [Anaerolineales bacterium]|nr:XdhC family protein [Anaerolineales bacterium]
MRDLLDQIKTWFESDQSVALATVIKTWGSSPRPIGAGMAVTGVGEIAGSVSGGCVESAVIEAALDVIKSGNPARLHFGVADDQAWDVGLSCGGEIEIFVSIFSKSDLDRWENALDKGTDFWTGLVVSGSEDLLGKEFSSVADAEFPIDPSLVPYEAILQTDGQIAWEEGKTTLRILDLDEESEVFFQVIKPAPTLILVGGVHIAIPLVELANIVGFEVVIIDPRKLFSSDERFPKVKELLQEWPEKAFRHLEITETSAIVMLTHDPKIDDPALQIALNSPAFYIGALGSKKTHQNRIQRLIDRGIETEKLDRIHAPVGLDLGGKSPQVIALGIMAEIILAWHKKEGFGD